MKLGGNVLRKLIPVAFVAAVLAFSALAQVPTLASNSDVGYGYRNNCGVKGDGMHDHGKLCPNRPFPGKGLGVLRILGGVGGTAISNSSSLGKHDHGHGRSSSTAGIVATGAGSLGVGGSSSDTTHGHGHSHGHGKALGRI